MRKIPFLSWDERGVSSEVFYIVSPPLDLLSMLFVGSPLESAEQEIAKVEIRRERSTTPSIAFTSDVEYSSKPSPL
jgi:hypothetical protein